LPEVGEAAYVTLVFSVKSRAKTALAYWRERRELLHALRAFVHGENALQTAKVHHGALPIPSRERHIRPLLARLDVDADRQRGVPRRAAPDIRRQPRPACIPPA
jgi:hypothetical protein